MDFKMRLPRKVEDILRQLNRSGHEAYVVGGCVRDALMSRAPADYDIATSAEPGEVVAALKGLRAGVIPTGLKHGTVTVAFKGERYEVTTFRVDGQYTDGRRPDSVAYTKSLAEDLRRRDFTINAMAYSASGGLVDLFGGAGDLREGVVRCVGVAAERFGEDYLRMLRAYRFAAALGFALDEEARAAIIPLRARIVAVAAERIRVELDKLLLSGNFPMIELFLEDFGEVLFPEVTAERGVVQNSVYHCYDVYDHTLRVIRHTQDDLPLRLAALLHDTGKPHTRTTDTCGLHHFKGHEAVSAVIATGVLKRFKYDNQTMDAVTRLIANHDDNYTPDAPAVKRMLLMRFGEGLSRKVLDLVEADTMGKTDRAIADKLPRIRACRAELERVIAAKEPYAVAHLAIGGGDVMAALGKGQGQTIGRALAYLVERVIDDPALNERETLLGLLTEMPDTP